MSFLHCHLHRCSKPGQRGGHIDTRRPRVDQRVFQELSRNHRGAIISYRHTADTSNTSLLDFFTSINAPYRKLLEDVIVVYNNIKVKSIVDILMENTQEEIEKEFHYATKFTPIDHEPEIDEIIKNSVAHITDAVDHFLNLGSFWRIKKILNIDVIVAKHTVDYHARPQGHLKMPIKNKKGFLNIENKDDVELRMSLQGKVQSQLGVCSMK